MIFLYEIPIMLILVLVLSVLGINIIPAIMVVTVLGLIMFIIGFGDSENKILSLIFIALHIWLLVFLYGKHLDLWDILTWLFNKN